MPFAQTEKTFQERPRMEALISLAFKREVIRKVTDVIAPLNDTGAGPPLYCVHSIGGTVTEFQHLVRMLGPKQKFYGIQVPTHKRNAEFARSIVEMSSYYVDELIKFQPSGAFLLGGYSIGATIALEMSQQLIAKGREVSLLVVFGGELPNTGAEISSRNPLYWLKLLVNVPRWTVDELVKNRRRFVNKRVARLKSVVFGRHKTNHRATHALESFLNFDSFLPDHAAFIKTLYDTHRDFVPKSYSGRVLVFVAKTQALMRLRQVEAAWKAIAPLSEVIHINGTHVSMMTMPHGLAVAGRLSKKFEEIADQSD